MLKTKLPFYKIRFIEINMTSLSIQSVYNLNNLNFVIEILFFKFAPKISENYYGVSISL